LFGFSLANLTDWSKIGRRTSRWDFLLECSGEENGMADAYEVAKYLIQLAASEVEPDQLTHLRLQKLLYYVQGWSIALRGPMFTDRIEAWAHGPVVKSVYPKFADFGSDPIPASKVDEAKGLTEDECDLIAAVWGAAKGFSAMALREKTHSEKPWIEARGKCGPADKCDTEITQKAMQEYFSTVVSA
jgi:uncharacterized phage-associated protein